MILLDTPTKSKDELKEIAFLEKLMEEMAGLPREELGKRQPGERGKYESTN